MDEYVNNTHDHTRKLDAILSELRSRPATSCGATPDVVQAHTSVLAEIKADLKNIDRTMVALSEKFDAHVDAIYEKVNAHKDELTVLKTEKKTAVSMLMSGAALAAFLIERLATFKFGGK